MAASHALYESHIPGLKLLGRGKVRDLYEVDDERLLIVTSDRLSAYDVVMQEPVPGKGRILTAMSMFWFDMMADIIPNHLTGVAPSEVIPDPALASALEDRAIVVRRLEPLPIEAVVRGYLIGSGWRDYLDTGAICDIALPRGLEQAARLPEPLFTPATKAAAGDHDENIGFEAAVSMIGRELADRVRDVSVRIYERAADHAKQRGIIIADTKFEFGLDADGELYVIDEMLTPDSSRFWPASEYRTGISPPSYDKQFVRDYLDTLDWDKTAPAPALPAEILRHTSAKYREALRILAGDTSIS